MRKDEETKDWIEGKTTKEILDEGSERLEKIIMDNVEIFKRMSEK